MDNVFGSPKLNRKTLKVNQRTGISQHFGYNTNLGYKSKASPRDRKSTRLNSSH